MAFGEKGKKKGFIPPSLQITSMMDMFTIILIFLLTSYSSNPETLDLDKQVSLPESHAKLDYKDSIKLVLTKEKLMLDGKLIATLKDGDIVGLNKLYTALESHRNKDDKLKEKILSEKNDGKEVPEEKKQHILFLCDKKHSFKTINSVVKTAGRAGYPNFQFAVIEKE